MTLCSLFVVHGSVSEALNDNATCVLQGHADLGFSLNKVAAKQGNFWVTQDDLFPIENLRASVHGDALS